MIANQRTVSLPTTKTSEKPIKPHSYMYIHTHTWGYSPRNVSLHALFEWTASRRCHNWKISRLCEWASVSLVFFCIWLHNYSVDTSTCSWLKQRNHLKEKEPSGEKWWNQKNPLPIYSAWCTKISRCQNNKAPTWLLISQIRTMPACRNHKYS